MVTAFKYFQCIGCILVILLSGCSTYSPNQAGSTQYKSPYMNDVPIVRTSDFKDCSSPPSGFTSPLAMPSRYQGSRAERDQENKTSTQRYLKQIEDIRLYERGLAKLTDRYLATGRKDEKLEACVLSWLHNWAMTNAMVQAATTSTGKAVRKWFLASVTASYLQLNRQLNKDVHIHHWLSSIAEQVINDYEPYFEKPDRINNHLYWAGLGVMLTGVATRRSDFYQWGIDSYKQGVNKINENGFLATEMARGQRALAYHNFALVPLVMMAEIGACNGQRLYSLNNHAVERLANAVISGLDNDSLFAKNTGEKQLKAKVETSHGLAWLEPYYHRFGLPPSGKKRLEHLRPMKHSYLGGNLTQLYQPH